MSRKVLLYIFARSWIFAILLTVLPIIFWSSVRGAIIPWVLAAWFWVRPFVILGIGKRLRRRRAPTNTPPQ